MKTFRLVSLVILLAVMGAGCPKKSDPLPPVIPPDNPKKIYDPDYGVSIVVPQDWKVSFRDGNPFLFAVAPGAGPYGPMVNVVTEQISQRLNPFDYLQANIPTMRLSLPDMKIVRSGIDLRSGVNVAWLQYTYPRGKQRIEAISFAQTIDYQAYVITAVAPADQFKKNEALFRAIGYSLKVDARR